MKKQFTPRLGLELGVLSLSRTIITTLYRMVYPFLPVIARGLGISLRAASWAITARSVVGLASPFLGGLSDRWGRKVVLLLGMGLFVLGALGISLGSTFAFFFAGMILTSAGKVMYDPTSQAYTGDQVRYQHRGLAMALVEISWSAAFLLGMPVVGWLIARGDWQAPFPWFAFLGIVMGFILFRILTEPTKSEYGSRSAVSLWEVIRKPSAAAMLTSWFLMISGVQMLYMMYGAWLEGAFLVQVVALGTVSAAFGLAELGGESLVAVFTDRLGKRRAVAWGLTLNTLACLALPLLGRSLLGAVTGLFLSFLSFEFALVSGLTLMTELVPEARGSMMATSLAVMEMAHGAGAFLGPRLFNGGILGISLAAVAQLLLAIVVLLRGVRRV